MEFTLEGLPPTTNKAYVPGRKLMLSTIGRIYKQEVRFQLLGIVDDTMLMSPDHWYGITLTYYFEALLTKTAKAKNPVLRIDTANREKLLVDTVCEVLGVDDSVILRTQLVKAVGRERVHIKLEKLHAFVDTAAYSA